MENELVPIKRKTNDLVETASGLTRISKNTRETYASQMRTYKKYCVDHDLKEDFDSLEAWILQTENSETMALRLAACRKVLSTIYKDDPRLNDLKERLRDIQPAHRNQAITESGYLKKDEVDKFMKAAPTHISLIFGIMFWTGSRISEALNIELANCIETPDGFIEIRIVGKRKKENIVYLSKKFFKKCNDYFKGEKYLIEHTVKGKKVQYVREFITREIARYGRIILDRDISAHIARHSKAAYLRDVMKLPIDKIQKALNHASMVTTAAYYLHGRASAKDQGIK